MDGDAMCGFCLSIEGNKLFGFNINKMIKKENCNP